jgi:hypothetical protein
MWHEPQSAPQFVFVCAGTLDDTSWATPVSHIWIEKADAPVGIADDAVCLEGQPADRQPLYDAFDRAFPRV